MTASVGPSEPQEAFLAGHLFVGAGEPVRLPHLAPLLAAIALRLKPRKPACIVLPSTENFAELIAVLVALHTLASDAADLTKQASDLIFVPGTRVRTLVGGYVFKVVSKAFEAGASGVWLQSAGKKSHELQAKIFFKNSAAVLFERTLSRRPIKHFQSRGKAANDRLGPDDGRDDLRKHLPHAESRRPAFDARRI